MRITTAILAILIALLFTACGGPNTESPYQSYAKKNTQTFVKTKSNETYTKKIITSDMFKNEKWISSPIQSQGSYFQAGLLRAHLTEGKVDYYQLYFSATYPKWKFYYGAYDQNGDALDFIHVINVLGSGDNVTQDFAFNVSRAYLEKYRDTGLTLRVYGDKGFGLFGFTASAIDTFLKKVDSIQK